MSARGRTILEEGSRNGWMKAPPLAHKAAGLAYLLGRQLARLPINKILKERNQVQDSGKFLDLFTVAPQ